MLGKTLNSHAILLFHTFSVCKSQYVYLIKMGRGKLSGRPVETLGGNLAIHLHPIQKDKWYSLSFQVMKTEMRKQISSSWVDHLASKQTHAHVSSNIPLPNVTAETRLLRSGLTTDELLDAKKRKKNQVWIQVTNSSPFWYVNNYC